MFGSILPSLTVNHTVLDVGSRLGAVLYGGYVFSEAGKIIGIEVNKELCDLQNHVIGKFRMSDRISIIHGEMTTRPDLFELADVIILNNVFEWFVETAHQISMWQFLCNNIKVGALIVSMPSLEKSTIGLQLRLPLQNWVRPYSSRNLNYSTLIDSNQDVDIHLYQVINKCAFQNPLSVP